MMDDPSRRLRVAILNRVFSVKGGGAERYSVALVEHMAAAHDIHVFAQQIDHDWPGVVYHRVATPFARPRWVNQLWYAGASWWATRQGFDIVHSHENTWHGNVQTMHVKTVRRSVWGQRTGWRRLIKGLQIALSPRLWTYLLLERARLQAREDRVVVAVSQTLAQEISQQYPSLDSSLAVITPGVEQETQFATKMEARHALSISASGKLILFVANDYRRKGLDTLLHALCDLPSDVGLLVVGNTSQKETYQVVCEALGISARVEFLGALPDLHLAYFAADVLAHPTLEDSYGMVVLEAMAHGLPVVVSCSDYCGIAADLEHGKNALLLQDPRDVQEVRQALRRVLYDESLAQTLARTAAQLVTRNSWDSAAKAYGKIYQRLVALT